jgi:hypothetical protein
MNDYEKQQDEYYQDQMDQIDRDYSLWGFIKYLVFAVVIVGALVTLKHFVHILK